MNVQDKLQKKKLKSSKMKSDKDWWAYETPDSHTDLSIASFFVDGPEFQIPGQRE
jgi:hypothetical protein